MAAGLKSLTYCPCAQTGGLPHAEKSCRVSMWVLMCLQRASTGQVSLQLSLLLRNQSLPYSSGE